MQLIKKIEVNYLRSLYGANLEDVGDLNVIFGRNDSGKSNLLRALNLFFNEEVEPGRNLEFDLDMSDRRKQEAREAKGRQFIWIKITFRVPSNYQGALGEEISIKRQWNRDGDMNQTVFPTLEGAGKQARLTRLLNEIDFTYIPAIKDLNVYADLIERIYAASAETEVLRDATQVFVDTIGVQVESLSHELEGLFGSPARLAPPTEMSQLFRNLDFSHGEEGHSLLRQKGDGIKARHLPELLRFINETESRKKFYLWGFEEPENSLDLGAAETEARRFAILATRTDTQVFITSHSPAFYLSDIEIDANIRRYFITKQVKQENGEMNPKNAAALIDDLNEAEARMEQAGLLQLPFVIRQMESQRSALKDKEEEAEKLRRTLSKLQQPTLFVEGPHDVSLFEDALSRVKGGDEITVKPLGGTPQSTEALISAVLGQGGISTSTPTLFLFDNDKAGRGAFRKLCTASVGADPVVFGNQKTMAWALVPTNDFKKFMRRHGLNNDQTFFTAEFLFDVNESLKVLNDILEGYDDQDRISGWNQVIHGDYWGGSLGQKRYTQMLNAKKGTSDWFYSRGVPDFLKSKFSKKIKSANDATDHIDDIAQKVRDSLIG